MNDRRKLLEFFEQQKETTEKRVAEGIEKHRKGDAVLKVTDKDGNAYVLSFWKKDGNDWVIDLSKPNIAGGGQYIATSTSAGVVYTYISSEDNECIRFCFRSENVSNAPTIYASETNEPGTLAGYVDEGSRAVDRRR